MNKKDLAALLSQGGLTAQQIEDLLTDFLNTERAKIRPKYEVIGEAIVEPEHFIKPEDMVKGGWYVIEEKNSIFWYMFKFNRLQSGANPIVYDLMVNYNNDVNKCDVMIYPTTTQSIRKATRQEVLRYFPTAFDIDKVTDEQL